MLCISDWQILERIIRSIVGKVQGNLTLNTLLMEMLCPPKYNPVGRTQGWVFRPLQQSIADINFYELQALHATDINLAVSDLPHKESKGWYASSSINIRLAYFSL